MVGQIEGLFRQLTHGVYVIGVGGEGQRNAFTAAWVMQVSFKPLLLALSVNPKHSSYAILKASGLFSVNVLGSEQQALARHFGAPASTDKLATVAWHAGRAGVPLLDEALAYFDCRFRHECEAGDHRLVVGRVVGGEWINHEARPMSYRDIGDMDESSGLYPERFE
jgi:flavin reductase (DIM6/NTAB) family NADH-FMN oxidoreductase RutF